MTSPSRESEISAYLNAKEKIEWLVIQLKSLPISRDIVLDLQGMVTDCELKIIELKAQQ